MARAFLDVNMFSERWFIPVREELLRSKNLVFTFSQSSSFIREFSRCTDGLKFYKLVGELRTSSGEKRRFDVDPARVEEQENFVNSQHCFVNAQECDDPHIFSLIYNKPTRYIFSMDTRLAQCRSIIQNQLDNRYCNFIVISDLETYKVHRQAIIC
jgi:hypothetical protein